MWPSAASDRRHPCFAPRVITSRMYFGSVPAARFEGFLVVTNETPTAPLTLPFYCRWSACVRLCAGGRSGTSGCGGRGNGARHRPAALGRFMCVCARVSTPIYIDISSSFPPERLLALSVATFGGNALQIGSPLGTSFKKWKVGELSGAARPCDPDSLIKAIPLLLFPQRFAIL